jgi:cytoskeleton protein RodZ
VEIEVEENSSFEEEFRFHSVGEKLKAERERLGLTLSDLAAKTRVPMRHLDAIEKSEFSALPGATYTLGFTRSYARAVELDATALSNDMRRELAQGGHESYQPPTPNFEPADPARVPSRTLAWTAAAIAVALVAAYLVWRNMTMAVPVALPPAAPVAPPRQMASSTPTATTTAAVAGGEVVITATDDVWIKIYDADNKRLYEKEMKAGDQFTVPADANNPMIVTGRPNALRVTVAGQAVPPLGEADRTIADVGVSAQALLARQAETAVPPAPEGAPATTGR